MPTRRDVLGAGAVALASASLGGCGSAGRDEYATVAAAIWRHSPGLPETVTGVLAELVRYATLAPSTYNSQCWRFVATRESITILPDPTRRSPAVDPDDHHLHVSLGCAAENIVQSAAAIGLGSVVETGPAPGDGITVRLQLATPARSLMADAIPLRQTTRAAYDGKPVPAAELSRLERIARGPGVTPVFATGAVQKRRLLELAAAASREWRADAAKLAELKRWTRFDEATALATRDGLAPGPAGRAALPPALGSALFGLLAASDRQLDQLVTRVRSSAGLLAFVAAVDDRAHWVEVGRAFQRFALLSTALGIRHDWVNAPTEQPALRPRLGMELGEPAGRPSLLLRFGYGPARPKALRRILTPELTGLPPAGSELAERLAPPTN
ncbi:MAG: Tat pathway signal protein [Chromatiales bacterium]|nr:Tat pathway signal protein [Chromatiales bacterium]